MIPHVCVTDDQRNPDHAAALFREHGALFLENAFPRSLIENLAIACTEKYESLGANALRKRDAMVGERRFMVTVNIKKPFNDPQLYANPTLMPILQRLLSVDLRIVSFGVVVALPGAEDQAIHLDHPPLFGLDERANGLPVWATTLVIPLVEITPENGPTAIWPGTHLAPDRIERLKQLSESSDYSLADKPTTQLGDAYMMDYRVIHGGLANRSDRPRAILYLVYGRPWFRDGFNFSSQPSVQISDKRRKKIPKQYRGLFRD